MGHSPPKDNVLETRFADALGERYLNYALSTIMARSLPDVRDGLKPVQRRLLYAMRQLKLEPRSGFKKCARVIGDVIGKYHPHGDVAVYDALVRLAQEFAQRYPLVDGQGNFGSIDGDNAAAMRYTEARLTDFAWVLLEGIDEDAADFRKTYDGEEEEPVVLPAGFPNLLANGATGIAVGMATSIPPHNIGELSAALVHLIRYPKATFEKLAEFIPGPDFPTGGVLAEPRQSVVEAYRAGRGSFRLGSRWQVEKLGRGLCQVVVTEIPYQVRKSRLIEKTAELVTAGKLPWLADIRDESADDLRIVLEPKSRAVDAAMLMRHVFRLTDFEVRVSLNMNVLDAANVPRLMNLRETLVAFLDHRHEVLLRRGRYRLEKIERRLEVLGGFLIAYLNLDEVIRIIRERDDAKAELIRALALTEVQAEAVLNMRLRQLRRLEETAIKDENKVLNAEREDLGDLLKDENRRWMVISGEIAEIGKRFGPDTEFGRRRTRIGAAPVSAPPPLEAMIERQPVTVLCSQKGWIRAVKGHIDGDAAKYKEGDRAKFHLPAQTTDKLLIFATNGRFYTIGCDKLPGGRGDGEPLRLMIELGNGHDVLAMFVYRPGRCLLVASETGRGFIVDEDETLAQTRNGKQVLNIAAGEEAAACVPVEEGADHVAALGRAGKLLIFPLAEVPVMARGRGVILQRYRQGGLADVKTFSLKSGLGWRTGRGMSSKTDLDDWLGRRGQAGRKPPPGFPRAMRFGG